MTPADHNKVIGIMHLIYGGFFTLVAVFMLVFFGLIGSVLSAAAAADPDAPPVAFIWAIMGFVFLLYFLLSLPGLVAGYAMLKRKPWARVAGIVSSILAGVSFPFGSALCVYSLWFFFGEAGRAFEQTEGGGSRRGSLGEARPFDTYAQTFGHEREREAAYRPPAEPPDWRS